MARLVKALSAAAGSAGGGKVYVEDVFSTTLYTGNNTNGTDIVNGIDLDGEGGLVWLKRRDGIFAHFFFSTESSQPYHYLSPDSNNAINTGAPDTLVAFNNNGFTLDDDNSYVGGMNTSGHDYVSWSFRKQEGFFDIVTWTGNSTASRAISHGLNAKVGTILVKCTSDVRPWPVYHSSVPTGYGYLDGSGAFFSGSGNGVFGDASYNNIAPTTSVFYVGSDSEVNGTGKTYVAYVFAEGTDSGSQIFGDGGDEAIIKTGTYNGNGTTDVTVDVGFEPQWLMIKRSSGNDTGNSQANSWMIFDNMRGYTATGNNQATLFANSTEDEDLNSYRGKLTSTGFIVNDSNVSNSGSTYVYMAIRRGPMKEPSAGTDVFSMAQPTSNAPLYKTGKLVDMAFNRQVHTAADFYLQTRLFSGSYLRTNTTDAANTDSSSVFDYQTGYYNSSYNDTNAYGWAFRRFPKVFDVVVYGGDGTSSRAITHNLGNTPSLAIFKSLTSTHEWTVINDPSSGPIYLASNAARDSGTVINGWSATTVTLGAAYGQTNSSSNNYLLLLFGSLDGISKVGTYTGTGNDINVTGLNAAARFVLIKRTDNTGDWYVFDTARGIVSGNDPYFFINSTAVSVTNTDYIDPHSSGFTITSSAPAALNASGGTYLYLAFA